MKEVLYFILLAAELFIDVLFMIALANSSLYIPHSRVPKNTLRSAFSYFPACPSSRPGVAHQQNMHGAQRLHLFTDAAGIRL